MELFFESVGQYKSSLYEIDKLPSFHSMRLWFCRAGVPSHQNGAESSHTSDQITALAGGGSSWTDRSYRVNSA